MSDIGIFMIGCIVLGVTLAATLVLFIGTSKQEFIEPNSAPPSHALENRKLATSDEVAP